MNFRKRRNQNLSHWRRMHFWILASALLAVGGCGRQNDDRGLVRLSVTSRAAIAYLPIYVGGPAGCFAREGIRVHLDETAGSAKSVQALVGGSVECCGL
jgi:NitT/TauT family transport system substrate-binding protein